MAIFQLACWFALLLAIVETVTRWALWRFFGKLPLGLTHAHAGWMTLTSELLLYAAVGMVLAVASWVLPRFPLWLPSAVFAGLFFYGLGDVIKVDQWYASMALAVGVAATVARSTARLQSLARRTLWPLAAAALVMAAGIYGWAILGEYWAAAALPQPPAGAPNVLFITLDTVRADHLSLYHYHRRTTPRLEEYARRGVVFDQAISTVSWTLPSHASLFTGYFPPEAFHDDPKNCSGDWKTPLDGKLPTLAEYFDAHGYRTGGFVANAMYCDRVYGLSRGYKHWEEYTLDEQQTLSSSYLARNLADWLGKDADPRFVLARKDGLTVNEQFLSWLDGVKGRPFFAFLNYCDSHDPYNPPPAFADLFSSPGSLAPVDEAGVSGGPDPVKLNPDAYDCALAALDEYVGRLLTELDRRGLSENTLVIILSDHGEHLGEHNYHGHGDTLYMPAIHVPLLFVWPGRVPAGVRVGGPASLRNIAATITDLVGFDKTASFPGKSLRTRWQERQAAAPPAFSFLDLWLTSITGKGDSHRPVRVRSVVDEHYHYIEGVGFFFRGLFDLKHDPAEDHDLSAQPAQKRTLEHYQALVERGAD